MLDGSAAPRVLAHPVMVQQGHMATPLSCSPLWRSSALVADRWRRFYRGFDPRTRGRAHLRSADLEGTHARMSPPAFKSGLRRNYSGRCISSRPVCDYQASAAPETATLGIPSFRPLLARFPALVAREYDRVVSPDLLAPEEL